MSYQVTTSLIRLDPIHPDPAQIAQAGQVIRAGGLVAFPTETVYGLGANALDREAVARIFLAKGRPSNDPLIVHVDTLTMLAQVAMDVPGGVHHLIARYWPGALTLILKKSDHIPDNVTAGQNTVAVRMPDHPIAQMLIHQAGVPIAAPSANLFSRPSPTTAQHVLHDLDGRVDLILDGGHTRIGVESTIVDLTSAIPMVLRPGGISLETLRESLPTLAFRPRHILDDEVAPAPGTLLKHYSPTAQMRVFVGEADAVYRRMKTESEQYHAQGLAVGILALDSEIPHFAETHAQIALLGEDDNSMASNLFAGIRELDEAGMDVILVRAPEQIGLGLAVYDRLLRSAEGQIIQVD